MLAGVIFTLFSPFHFRNLSNRPFYSCVPSDLFSSFLRPKLSRAPSQTERRDRHWLTSLFFFFFFRCTKPFFTGSYQRLMELMQTRDSLFSPQPNPFSLENPSYQRLMELMQTRDPFYKPPQPSPVDDCLNCDSLRLTSLFFFFLFRCSETIFHRRTPHTSG